MAMTVHSKSYHLSPERCYVEWLAKMSLLECNHVMATSSGLFGRHASGSTFRVCSMCSGSESPILWFMAGVRVLRSRHLDVAVDHPSASPASVARHIFACEIDRPKQVWIEINFKPELLFNNICYLGRNAAYDVLSGSMKNVLVADAAIAGTSCVDLSNQKDSQKSGVLESGVGMSSETMIALLSYCARYRPLQVSGENVWTIVCVSAGYLAQHAVVVYSIIIITIITTTTITTTTTTTTTTQRY